jgi:hypothetical protein
VYECIKFRTVRLGEEEAEFESTGTLPFHMSMVVPFSAPGSVHFERRWAGADVRDVRRFMRAIKSAHSSGVFEIYDLERALTLFKPRLTGDLPAWFSGCEELINDAVRVADFYRIDLRIPEEPTREDLESLSTLAHLIDGNLSLDINNITFTLTKTANLGNAQAETFRGEGTYLITLPEYFERPVLFGVPVCTGPVAYHFSRARVENPEKAYRFYQNVTIGENQTLTLKPLCSARARASARRTTSSRFRRKRLITSLQ